MSNQYLPAERKRVCVCQDDGGDKLVIVASFDGTREAYAWLRGPAVSAGRYTIISQIVAGIEVATATMQHVTTTGGQSFVTRTPPTKPRKPRSKKKHTSTDGGNQS